MKTSGFHRIKTAVLSIVKMVGQKNISLFAAAADYFFFMSLVPIIMLLVSLIRFLPFEQADVMQIFAETVPESVYRVLNTIISSIYRNGSAAFTISLLLTVFSASGAIRPLMKGLDIVYGDERKEFFPLFFLKAVLYMVVMVVFIILSIAILVYGGGILELLNSAIPGSSVITWLLRSGAKILRYVLVSGFLFAGFLLLYSRLPAKKRKASAQWPGALFSAVSWVGFSWIFSIYVSLSDKFGAYGYIGTIMVAMMWIYYCMMFLLIGGCINVYFEKRRAGEAEAT